MTTFLTAFFLCMIGAGAVFLVHILSELEGLSDPQSQQLIKSQYVTELGDTSPSTVPKIITIQGSLHPTTSGDTTPLRIVSVKPANGATGVAVTSPIIVTFSKPVQASTVSTATFKLTTTGPGTSFFPSIVNIPGTVTLSADGKTATFRPEHPLAEAKYHYYSITGVKDVAGNPLTPFPNVAGSFTTR